MQRLGGVQGGYIRYCQINLSRLETRKVIRQLNTSVSNFIRHNIGLAIQHIPSPTTTHNDFDITQIDDL